MKASAEFAVGKHGIGYVSDSFQSQFSNSDFEIAATPPTFQALPRRMSDAVIESELKPGYCSLGDVLAFIKAPPEGTKDGYANLFYFPSCVVFVRWYGAQWHVHAWERDAFVWHDGYRVFSPVTGRSSTLIPAPLGAVTLETLDDRVRLLEQAIVKLVAQPKPKKRSSIKKKVNRKR